MHQALISQTLAQIEASNKDFFKAHHEYRKQAHKNIISASLLTSSRGQVQQKELAKLSAFKVTEVHDGDSLHLRVGVSQLRTIEQALQGGTLQGSALQGGALQAATSEDVVDAEASFRDIKVRLFGIDSPETNQFFGNKSSEYLRNLVLNKKVKVKFLAKDIYDRYLVVLFYKGINLNFQLVKEGLAFPYYEITNNTVEEFVFKKAFAYAIRHSKGMWDRKLWSEELYPLNPFLFKRQ